MGALLVVTAAAIPGPKVARASADPIQHIVVLYLENHSFDSLLGYWCRQTGTCVGMPDSVTLKDGIVVTPSVTTADRVPYVKHTVPDQIAAVDGGKMDGWARVPGCSASTNYACISGYAPSSVPNLVKLASTFAISDMTFSMAESPSWGGHLYAVMASTDGFLGSNPLPPQGSQSAPESGEQPAHAQNGWGCDSGLVSQWRDTASGKIIEVPSCVPDPNLNSSQYPYGGAFESTPVPYQASIMDELTAAGISWKIYGSHAGQAGYMWATCPSLASCLDQSQESANLVDSEQFDADATNGQLPGFSLVLPGDTTAPNSEHNGASITRGDNWIGDIASRIMNGPEWDSTVLFISSDDCGCFYDQVAPGTNPDGTSQGPRVPLIIVSPYVVSGYVDTTPTTIAGVLAYVENTFGLPPLGANDANAYAFENAFNYAQTPLRPVSMTTRPLPPGANEDQIDLTTPLEAAKSEGGWWAQLDSNQ